MSRFRRNKPSDFVRPFVCVAFGGAFLCLCFLSVKILLAAVAIILIVLGIWLLKCC